MAGTASIGWLGNSSLTYATWDPANTASGITLTNGNLTATASSADVYATRCTIGKSSGKWFAELVISAAIVNSISLGIKTSSEGNTVLVGSTANGYGYTDTGEKKNNGVDSAYGTAPANGISVGIAFDLDTGSITFYREGVSQGVAFSGISGTFYVAFSSGFGANAVVANFGQNPFNFGPPVGYNPGVYN